MSDVLYDVPSYNNLYVQSKRFSFISVLEMYL